MDVLNVSSASNTSMSAKVPSLHLDKLSVHSHIQNLKPELNQKQHITKEELSNLVDKMNNDMKMVNDNIKFGFSEELKQLIVEVKDTNTGNVIQKFPSEDAIDLAKKVKELVGIIFDTRG